MAKKMFSCYLSEDLIRKIKEISEDLGISQAKFIELACIDLISKKPKEIKIISGD